MERVRKGILEALYEFRWVVGLVVITLAAVGVAKAAPVVVGAVMSAIGS